MLLATYLAAVLFIFLLIQWKLTSKGRKTKNNNSSSTKQLKPIPSYNIIAKSIWFLTAGRRRIPNFLNNLVKLYDIVQTRYFKVRVIFISDFKLGKEAFSKSAFSGRQYRNLTSAYMKGSHGILFSQGEKWKQQRKFSTQHLTEFGFNTKSMEQHIRAEIDDLIQNWCDKNEKPFSPNKAFYIHTLSTIWGILSGERVSAQNQQLVKLACNAYEALGKVMGYPEIFLLAFKFQLKTLNRIATWLPIFPGVFEFQEKSNDLYSYVSKVLKAKKEKMNINENPRDLMEVYLKEIAKTSDPKSGFYGKEGELNIMVIACDYFFAGGDTTASMITWCILHLIRNPAMQEKIYSEINAIVGPDCRLSLDDRPNCPYIQSFIWEVLRFNPFAIIGLPHEAMEDTNIGQYFVRKETAVFLNIYGIHHDPKIWGDPENFRPERFLSADGLTFTKHEALCPFSIGQRQCPGKQLALDNMFLFISAICQRFFLKPDPMLNGMPEIQEITKSIFFVPEKFNMVVLDRLKMGKGSGMM